MKKFKVQYIPEDGFDWETDYSTNNRKKALKHGRNLAKNVYVDAVRVIRAKRIFFVKVDPFDNFF